MHVLPWCCHADRDLVIATIVVGCSGGGRNGDIKLQKHCATLAVHCLGCSVAWDGEDSARIVPGPGIISDNVDSSGIGKVGNDSGGAVRVVQRVKCRCDLLVWGGAGRVVYLEEGAGALFGVGDTVGVVDDCGDGGRYFFITDRVANGKVTIEWCPTADMVGDYMTKPLQGNLFKKFRDIIMGIIRK